MGLLPYCRQVARLLLILGLCLYVKAYICEVGREQDETNVWRWVLPYGNPCECTKIIMGGMNTWTPIRPFKPVYVDSPLLSDEVAEIRKHYGLVCFDNIPKNSSSENHVAPTSPKVSTTTGASTRKKASTSNSKAKLHMKPSTNAPRAPNRKEASTTTEAPNHEGASTINEAPNRKEASTTIEKSLSTYAPITTSDKPSLSMSTSTAAPVCQDYLGMKNGDITDANIRASSQTSYRPASQARLIRGKSWAAPYGSSTAWIQADIGYQTNVSGVITQGDGGSGTSDDWVTTFKVSTAVRSNEEPYTFVSDNNGNPLVFDGNIDPNSLKMSYFPQPVLARIVRILCLTKADDYWQMRFEVLGCKLKSN